MVIPTLREGDITIRPVRLRDARLLERELLLNRSWLRGWEATNPVAPNPTRTLNITRGESHDQRCDLQPSAWT